jgi:sialidase-1
MPLGPDDYLIRRTMTDIGTLDVVPFSMPCPSVDSTTLTIAFWFRAQSLARMQVLANTGDNGGSWAGWSVYLFEGQLAFRAGFDGGHVAVTTVAVVETDRWYHFAGVIDRTARTLTGYLDGSTVGWQARHPEEFAQPNPTATETQLVLGGYTDPAGGHYDHTFGRNRSGLIDEFRLYDRTLSAAELLTFIPENRRPPTARFSVDPDDGQAPLVVKFDATDSRSEADSIFYLWDFGDGATGVGLAPTHRYAYAGTYTVRLTVVDENHDQASTTRPITLSGRKSPLNVRPVFVNGQEGYACYRIPAIVRAANGDLVAFAEGRLAECSDSTPIIRLVCKRSTDNGASWEPLQTLARNLIDGGEYACMNPSPVVEAVHGTGRIVVVFNKNEHSEWDIVRGLGVNRVCAVFSDDHGRTWHRETDITRQVHKPYNPGYTSVYPDAALPENKAFDWRKQAVLPGHAIQLQQPDTVKGRLFFMGSRTAGDERVFGAQNYAFWSDDVGASWQIGGLIGNRADGTSAKGLGEPMAVALDNGEVLINSRNYQDGKVVGRRAVTRGSFDRSGQLEFQPTYHDAALVDSGVQASLICFSRSDEAQYGGQSRILFANPDHPQARVNMTVRLSYDEGKTWPVSKVIDPGPSAYSDLVIQDDMKIGLLYERGNQGGIAYTNFSLEWLESGDIQG